MIAARYGASVALLAEANGLEDPDRIRAGAVLVLAATPAASTDDAQAATTHVVLPGDTLWAISAKTLGNGAHYEKIFEANKPMLSHPDKIYPGQVLRIPV